MMVRVDICCVTREVSLYHHLILTLLGTIWHRLWYELHLLVLQVDMGTSWHLLCGNRCQLVPLFDTCLVGYELTSNSGTSWHHLWYELTSIAGTSWHGYELTWVRIDMGTSWPVFVQLTETWQWCLLVEGGYRWLPQIWPMRKKH